MTQRPPRPAPATLHADAPRRTLARRGPAPLVLEPRIMFDAAGAEAAVRHAIDHVVAEAPAHVDTAALAAPAVTTPAPARTEIVFVEDDINNVAQLVASVRSGVEVIMLDHTRDGLQQMVDALAGHAQVDAIHVVSHGADGQLSLGALTLSVDNIESERGQLAQLGSALHAGGDLLLYGCDVGLGTTGAGFVDRIAALTGADVAASTDVTGSSAFGGNWTLEAHSGTIETRTLELDRAGWQGELVNTVYDANWQALNFNGANVLDIIGNGKNNNDVVRFNSVITIGGQAIDAVVTTTLDRVTMTEFDSTTNPSSTSAYFQPTMTVNTAGGSASFKVAFYLAGTYTGAGTGTAVTLQQVVINSYDIDGVGNTYTDRQFQDFQGFSRYELANNTALVASTQSDGSVLFQYTAASGYNNPSSTLAADAYRVKVYYDSLSSFVLKAGATAAGTAQNGFNGTAYFALDFSAGPAWSGATTITGTPAANITWSTTTFAEAPANDGSITATATITLANSVFSGVDNAVLSGVTFSNLPAGLTALVTRTSATTATLSFTGNALAHASANDISNFGVSFGDAAFKVSHASAVTGASRADLVIDFADPDTTAPVVTARTDSYAENRAAGTVVTTVAATDAVGVTGFRFAATGTTTSADGYFAISAAGAISLTAAGAAAGSSANDYELTPHQFSMDVQACDAAGNWSLAQNVTLNVTNIDEQAPTFTSAGTGTALENQNVLYRASAVDAVDFTDGHVTYSLQAGTGDASLLAIDSTSGVVTLRTGSLDFETRSSYQFIVVAQDASGNARSLRVGVTVQDVDEVPPTVTIASDRTALKAGDTANLTFTFSEDVGASFTASDITVASGAIGTLVQIDATHYSAIYTPGAGVTDSAVVISVASARVQDLAGNLNDTGASVTLAVDTVAPAITGPAAITVAENTTAVHQYGASESVVWSIAGGEDAARFTLGADGTLAFASAPDFEHPQDGATNGSNTYLVNLRAVDSAGNATVQAVTVSIADVNEAPTGSNASFHVDEDTVYTGALPAAQDPDGDALTYALGTNGAHGQATVNADGTFAYLGAANYHGADSFTYTVADGRGGQATYTVSVTVNAVNDAPVAAPGTLVTSEDTPLNGNLPVASDADGDTVTYTKASDPSHGVLTVSAFGSYSYTPAANFNGSDSFTYSVSDGNGGSNTYTVAITVTPVNDAPVAAAVTINAVEDTPVTGSLPLALDADGDSVTYALGAAAGHGTAVVHADGTYSYTPAANYNGADTFSYTVSDGHGGASTYVATIDVAAVNDAPVGAGAVASGIEDTPLAGRLPMATDADGDAITYAVSTAPQHGAVTVNGDGTYLYTPGSNFNGSDSFAYSVTDDHGGSNVYTVALTVAPVNDAPHGADPVAASGTVGQALTPVVVGAFTDVDSPVLTYSATRADGTPLPAWLTFDAGTRTLSGTPPPGTDGTLVVHVSGSDGALSATTDVTLTIYAAPAPAQTVAITGMSKDTGTSAQDFITADGSAGRTVTGTLSGPLGANDALQVSFDGGATFAPATVSGSSWSAVDTGAHGAGWTIVADVTNSVTGRTGTQSAQRVTLDTAAPQPPTVDPIAGAGTLPVITGSATLAPGESLTVTIGGASYPVTPHDGVWSLTPSTPLAPGQSFDVVATVVDTAGNRAAATGRGTVSVPVPVTTTTAQLEAERAYERSPAAPADVAPAPVDTPVPPVSSSTPATRADWPDPRLQAAAPGSTANRDAWATQLPGSVPGTPGAAGLRQLAELSDMYTRDDGFRTVVARSDTAALLLFQGVPDQFIDAGDRLALTVPSDAFVHTQPRAIVRLTATLQDGRPLPRWIAFHSESGQFTGEPPPGVSGELAIKLTARDVDGREATALFRINIGHVQAAPGKSGLSEQLRRSGATRVAAQFRH